MTPVLGQPMREHTAGRAGAHHDEIELVVRHSLLPRSNINFGARWHCASIPIAESVSLDEIGATKNFHSNYNEAHGNPGVAHNEHRNRIAQLRAASAYP